MSKVLVIPDVHMKKEVIEHGLQLARKHWADKIIMLGDYFDDWYAMNHEYTEMIQYLKKLLRGNPNVIPLFGNHELSYLGYPCSGFNRIMQPDVYNFLIKDYRFTFCYAEDGILYSHAGVTTSWLKNNRVVTANGLRLKLHGKTGPEIVERGVDKIDSYPRCSDKLLPFDQVGPARGGNSNPSLVWADLTELIADPAPFKQVVGHTPVKQIENIGRIWFTDVFSNGNPCNEYLLVKDGEPEIIRYELEDMFNGRR